MIPLFSKLSSLQMIIIFLENITQPFAKSKFAITRQQYLYWYMYYITDSLCYFKTRHFITKLTRYFFAKFHVEFSLFIIINRNLNLVCIKFNKTLPLSTPCYIWFTIRNWIELNRVRLISKLLALYLIYCSSILFMRKEPLS